MDEIMKPYIALHDDLELASRKFAQFGVLDKGTIKRGSSIRYHMFGSRSNGVQPELR